MNVIEDKSVLMKRFLTAISMVNLDALRSLSLPHIKLVVPGSTTATLTALTHGVDQLCEWTQTIHKLCGVVTVQIDRELHNETELMAVGQLTIDKYPSRFCCPCSLDLCFQDGLVSSIQLLCDTFALEQFRGD